MVVPEVRHKKRAERNRKQNPGKRNSPAERKTRAVEARRTGSCRKERAEHRKGRQALDDGKRHCRSPSFYVRPPPRRAREKRAGDRAGAFCLRVCVGKGMRLRRSCVLPKSPPPSRKPDRCRPRGLSDARRRVKTMPNFNFPPMSSEKICVNRPNRLRVDQVRPNTGQSGIENRKYTEKPQSGREIPNFCAYLL